MMRKQAKYLTALPTAAVLVCSYMGNVSLPEPTTNMKRSEVNVMSHAKNSTITNLPVLDNISNLNYTFASNHQTIEEQINIIHNFVSLLLRESQDLDPKYSKVVDKYFWDLG